jgi:hypothetical protein
MLEEGRTHIGERGERKKVGRKYTEGRPGKKKDKEEEKE